MNLMHIIAPVEFGGGESLLINLLSEKVEGVNEFVCLIYDAETFKSKLDEIGVTYSVLTNKSIGHGISKFKMGMDTLSNLIKLGELELLAEKWSIDAIHVHGFPSCVFYALNPTINKLPAVYTHHFFRKKPRYAEKKLLSWVYSKFDVCTGVSELVSRSMNEAFDFCKCKFEVIYNCVGKEFFTKKSGEKFNYLRNHGKIIFLQVARFVDFKNHELVVDSVLHLPDEYKKKVIVVFAGDGPLKDKITTKVADHKLERNFVFLGAVDYADIPDLVSIADYGLFPSENEGFGIGAVECLAGGLPVLCLDNELMREIVGDAGVLCKKDELDKGIIHILSMSRSWKNVAKLRAEKFRPNIIKRQYIKKYLSAIDAHSIA